MFRYELDDCIVECTTMKAIVAHAKYEIMADCDNEWEAGICGYPTKWIDIFKVDGNIIKHVAGVYGIKIENTVAVAISTPFNSCTLKTFKW